MSDEYGIVDIWVGQFRNQADFDSYMRETINRADDVPISQFAAEQHELFYDPDFVEASFHKTPGDFAKIITGHSSAKSYYALANAAFESSGIRSANVVILVFGREISQPRSTEGSFYSLTYLGRFDCEPDPPTSLGDDGPPTQIFLVFPSDASVMFNGEWTSIIPVDSRGLIVGRDATEVAAPRLDLSQQVAGIATDQLRIYQDQFDQWIAEDVGANGLTRLDGELLNGPSFPWNGKRLAIGDVKFVWSTRTPESLQ